MVRWSQLLVLMGSLALQTRPAEPDLILHNGKVVTVDDGFTVTEAIAIRDGQILAVGTDRDLLALRGERTKALDLQGRTVIPGLIDSHVHPEEACITEFDHLVPDMQSIPDVLAYVKARAAALGPGKWIEVRQVFITRLFEQRYPTRAELDDAAPRNPVLFATGPDASLNSLAMERSGISKGFRFADDGPGRVETNPVTGEPTGILRSCTRLVKVDSPERRPSETEHEKRTLDLFRDYNSVGLTSIGDRDASPGAIERYRRMAAQQRLTVRISVSAHVDSTGPMNAIEENIRRIARDPLSRHNPMLQIIGIKTYLDGGMLTGSAYMREPWGVSKIYSITEPEYRGLLFIPPERLAPMVRAAVESGLQFTAHSVGDGAVHALLDAYRTVDRTMPIRSTRPCITHSNFMSREAVESLRDLGVMIDVQPVWLYLDTRTLVNQFGYDRLRYFQPLRSVFEAGAVAGGGSDHMQKIGSWRSINPYNPFLGIATAITRTARGYDGALHAEEALSREQALRLYTINNARILFREREAGSIEPGKRADLAILDRDILTCPVEAVKNTQVLATYLDGRLVFGTL